MESKGERGREVFILCNDKPSSKGSLRHTPAKAKEIAIVHCHEGRIFT